MLSKILFHENIAERYAKEFFACKDWFSDHGELVIYACITILFSLLLFFLFRFLLHRILPRLLAKRFPMASKELKAISSPFSLLILWMGLTFATHQMGLPDELDFFLCKIYATLYILTAVSISLRLIDCIAVVLASQLEEKYPDTYSMNKLLLDLSKSIAKLFLWCCAIFVLLQNAFRVNVEHLLVSAGVLGLGIAFAAQNTIANIFGAFSILGAKLFKVGDRIKIGDKEGTVEQIGFRSVRLRAPSGLLIDIPNRLISDSALENYSNRHFWREHFCYGLVYQTAPEQIQLALRILDEIGHDLADLMVPEKKVKFTFLTCNNSSLDLDGYVWFNASNSLEMRDARGKFNEEVFKRFTEAGLSFAYPTTTVFLEEDGDVPAPKKK